MGAALRALARVAIAAVAAVPSVAIAQGPDTLMGPGVSLELARMRARDVRDVRYELTLDVTSPDTALGRVVIRWNRRGSADAIVDFRGLRVYAVVANGLVLPSSQANGAHILFPASALKAGENVVEVAFVSAIAPAGASIIKSHDPDGSDYLYTLLVPADANQLFPCFDQPDLKARVRLQLTVPSGWRAVANGGLASTRATAGKTIYAFNETRPLSTYLIAFAAGPWEVATSTDGVRPINVYVRKSRMKEADTDTLLALNRRAIEWMESYFGVPYPYEKFDFVLAPAFPFGGMEHPGAVFYNENSFIFRERPTLARRLGRFSTILHEVAHQWFGDLVTMRWFDDLWLKEGFATYMAAKAQYALDSTTGAWKTFYQGNKPSAYGVDQTTGTNSLWQKLANLDQAKSNYGAIVYNKAPSVLKQLNYLVGEQAFQKGVREFLTTHSYGNATWQDLLSSIGGAAERSLDEFGKNFMTRPGMPIVEQRLTVANGRIEKLELVQRPAQSLSGPEAWPMRTQVLLAYDGSAHVRIPVELRGAVTEVEAARGRPAPRYVFANYEDYGYFVTLLDSASIAALEAGALRTVRDPLLRTMLWGALWDLVRDAKLDPARFVRLVLTEGGGERDEQILPNLLSRLSRSLTTYMTGNALSGHYQSAEDMLWMNAISTARTFGERRAFIDAFINIARTPMAVDKLTTLYSADSVAGEPMRDPTRWEIVNRLLEVGAPSGARLLAMQTARDTTPDGRRRAFIAGVASPSADAKQTYFTRYFADKTLNEEWASGSLGAFNASLHANLTLPYLRTALDSLPYIQANRRIFFLGNWLNAFIGGQRSPEALAIVQKYLSDNPSLPLDLRQKVLQTMDELERTVRIRRTWTGAQ